MVGKEGPGFRLELELWWKEARMSMEREDDRIGTGDERGAGRLEN